MRLAGNPGKETASLAAGQEGERLEGEEGKGKDGEDREGGRGTVNGTEEKKTA